MKTIIAIAFATSIIAGNFAFGQQGMSDKHTTPMQKNAQAGPSMAMCKQMMADKAKMAAHMRDMETKLDNLVSNMDRSRGDEKMNALVNVVKEMVAQRKMMDASMRKMDSKMMDHMMKHMNSGKGMANCPMMKGA